ncbi:mechanosensitive ion channel family protein [bacterium]|nr:mechanosensitive ion channel family protein [bacterium]
MLNFLRSKELILGIETEKLFFSLAVLVLTFLIKKTFSSIIGKRLLKIVEKTASKYDDIIINAIIPPIKVFITLTGLYYAIFYLDLHYPKRISINPFLFKIYTVALSTVSVWCFFRLTDFVIEIFKVNLAKKSSSEEELSKQLVPMLHQVLKIIVISLGGILVVQTLGYSVGSLLAGIGIGGLAIALAAQETLANLFGTVVIVVTKPFKVGEMIKFNNYEGTIESITFRSTQIRSLSRTLITVPNKMITSEAIENLSAMEKRRVRFTIGLTYSSSSEKIQSLVTKIKLFLDTEKDVIPESSVVVFNEFGASSLDILVQYFTVEIDFKLYLETKQKINFKIMELVKNEGLEFAFPSKSIYFENPLQLKKD